MVYEIQILPLDIISQIIIFFYWSRFHDSIFLIISSKIIKKVGEDWKKK